MLQLSGFLLNVPPRTAPTAPGPEAARSSWILGMRQAIARNLKESQNTLAARHARVRGLTTGAGLNKILIYVEEGLVEHIPCVYGPESRF